MAFVETLKPLTVPVGLIALGTVARIGNDYFKMHITDGVHVIVQQPDSPAPLRELFQVGQQYICKIIDAKKRERKTPTTFSSIDLIASVDPSIIYEDFPTAFLRTPNALIQGRVKSVEDHGYQVDIGFNQVFGFLSYKENRKFGVKYKEGQIIKCSVKQPMVESTSLNRILSLSAFDEESSLPDDLPETFVLPGVRTFGIVIKVVKSAIVLKIMNKFNAFAKLSEGDKEYKISDKVHCYILHYHPVTKTFAVSLQSPAKLVPTVVNKEKERVQKSRFQRSEEARLKEERLRKAENDLIDINRHPQCTDDFERVVFGKPDEARGWISYSRYHLDNADTDAAREICRRALKTINFRLQKEKLKIWGHLFNIEARFGGMDRFREVMNEALAINDKLAIYQSATKALVKNRSFKEAEEMFQLMSKRWKQDIDVWCDYIEFMIQEKRDFDMARQLEAKAVPCLSRPNVVRLKSKYAQLEFKYGEPERAKTIFNLLITNNPKRRDLLQVYDDMVRKYDSDKP